MMILFRGFQLERPALLIIIIVGESLAKYAGK